MRKSLRKLIKRCAANVQLDWTDSAVKPRRPGVYFVQDEGDMLYSTPTYWSAHWNGHSWGPFTSMGSNQAKEARQNFRAPHAGTDFHKNPGRYRWAHA